MKRKDTLMRALGWILFLAVVVSCDSSMPETAQPLLSSDFMPLKKGTYFIYAVDDTKIELNVSSNSVYELKLMVADSFRNDAGSITYVVNRYKRADNTKPWTPLETWTMRQDESGLVFNESNVIYYKLSSPLFIGQQWNGNLYNTLGGSETCGANQSTACDIYRVESLNTPYQIASKTYDKTLVIAQSNDPDILVTKDIRKEIYAQGVGLIYKESEVLHYCTTGACYTKQIVDSGIRYKQTLKEYGVQ